MARQEANTDYVNSIQDAINDAKAKAEDFNSREKVSNIISFCELNLRCASLKSPPKLRPAQNVFLYFSVANKFYGCTNFGLHPQVFGFPPTEYHVLGKVEEELEPFYKLWNMISDFQASRKEWLHGSFLGKLPLLMFMQLCQPFTFKFKQTIHIFRCFSKMLCWPCPSENLKTLVLPVKFLVTHCFNNERKRDNHLWGR